MNQGMEEKFNLKAIMLLIILFLIISLIGCRKNGENSIVDNSTEFTVSGTISSSTNSSTSTGFSTEYVSLIPVNLSGTVYWGKIDADGNFSVNVGEKTYYMVEFFTNTGLSKSNLTFGGKENLVIYLTENTNFNELTISDFSSLINLDNFRGLTMDAANASSATIISNLMILEETLLASNETINLEDNYIYVSAETSGSISAVYRFIISNFLSSTGGLLLDEKAEILIATSDSSDKITYTTLASFDSYLVPSLSNTVNDLYEQGIYISNLVDTLNDTLSNDFAEIALAINSGTEASTAISNTITASEYDTLMATAKAASKKEIHGSIKSITVTTDNTEFNLGEVFNSTDIVVTATYESGDTGELSSDECTIDSSAYNSNTVGTYSIVVENEDVSTSYDVSVVAVITTTNPEISSIITPSDGSTNVAVSSNIVFEFNQSMDSSVDSWSLNFETGSLDLDSSNSTISYSTTTNSNDTITIDPNSDLNSEATYGNLTISGFQGTNGNEMNSYTDSSYEFTTADTTIPSGYSVTINQSNITSSNETAMSFTFTDAEVGATYNYSIDDTDGSTDAITGSGTIATATDQITGIDISNLADDTLTLTVYLTDTNGNQGSSVTDTVSKDSTASSGYSVFIDQTTITSSNETAMSFTFKDAEVGDTYTYSIDDTDGSTNAITGNGTIITASDQIENIDVSSLTDGTLTLTLTVYLTDSNGNQGSTVTATVSKDSTASSGYSVFIDQTTITSSNETAMSFTFTGAEVGATYTYCIDDTDESTNAITGSGTIATATDQITGIDVSSLADDTLTLTVYLTDTNGNQGSTVTATVSKDSTASSGYSVTIDQTAITSSNETAMSFTFSDAEIGATYTYSIDDTDDSTNAITGSGTIATATDQITGIDVSSLADDTLTLTVYLTDSNGNQGSNVTATVSKDSTASSGYSVTIDQSAITSSNETAMSFTFTGAEVGATYTYSIDDTDESTNAITGSGTIATATDQITGIDVSSLADDTLTLTVYLTDSNGNQGVDVTHTVSKDSTASSGYSVTIDQTAITSSNETAMSFTFTGAEVGATYTYSIDDTDGSTDAITGNGTIITATDQITGIDVSSLADDTLTLTVYLTDSNGNQGVDVTHTVSKDSTASSGYSVTIDQTAITSSNETAMSFTFKDAEVGATYAYSIDDTDGSTSAITGSGTIASADQQISSIDVSSLTDGTLTLTVYLTDNNENKGTDVTDSITKDIIAPTVTNVSSNTSDGTYAIGDEIEIAIEFSEDVVVTDTPTLTLETGSTDRTASYSSGSGSSTLLFTYTVQSGDETSDLDYASTTALSGTIKDNAGNDATLTLANHGETNSLGANSALVIDGIAPSGYSVGIGQSAINSSNETAMSFTFTGAEIGATYTYSIDDTDDSTNAITGNGTVATATDIISSIDVSSLNDGTLTLTVYLTDTNGNQGTDVTDTISKDSTASSGYSVTIDQSAITSSNETAMSFTFTGAEVGATYTYSIDDTDGSTDAITGTGTIITATDQITGLDVSGLSDGTLTLTVYLTDSNGNQGSDVTDTTTKDIIAPTVTNVSCNTSDGAYITGDEIEIAIEFSEDVVVTDTPTLTLETGSTDRTASYSSGSGSSTLVFTYIVQSGDETSDLDYASTTALSGTIKDNAGNDATLTLASPGGTNSLGANSALVIDGVAPTVTNVSSNTSDGTYIIGDEIEIAIEFSEDVVVTDTPTLTLETGSTDRTADYSSESGSSTLVFTYTVQSGDETSDLDYASTTALSGTIKDNAGNDAILTLANPGGTNSLGANSALVIDGIAPSGYNVGIGQSAINSSNETTMSFTFTDAEVGATYAYSIDDADDSTNAITGSGIVTSVNQQISSIDVSSLTDGTLTLTVYLTDNNENKGTDVTDSITKDIIAPTVSNVSSNTSDGTYIIGDEIEIAIEFSEDVVVTDTPTLTLETGSTDRTASYSSGSGSSTLVFTYTVQSGDETSDLDYASTTALSGTIKDNAGNDATLTLANPGETNSLSANNALVIDGVAPTVTNVSSNTSDGTYIIEDEIEIAIEFSEDVVVTDTPTLTLETGSTDRTADYSSESGSSTLVFTYTVQSGDETSDLDYASTTALSGTIKDNAGNEATLTLANPGETNSLGANSELVIDGIAPSEYSVGIGQSAINSSNETAMSFTFTDAEVGATYTYSIDDTDDSTNAITGNGTIASANQQIINLDVSSLVDGILTLTVYLTDTNGNQGTDVTDSITKDIVVPSGYSIDIDQSTIYSSNETEMSFTFTGAEIGATYAYSIDDTDDSTNAITGNGTIASADQQISSIDVSSLTDGTLTLTVSLTDSNENKGTDVTDTITKDIIAPTVSNVSSNTSNGTYIIEDEIEIAIEFSEDVVVTDTPSLTLETGTTDRTASYLSGSGSSTLVFTYTVQSGDETSDLDYASTTALSGTIKDNAGNEATLTLANPGETNSLSANSALVIDGIAPSGYTVDIDQSTIYSSNETEMSFTFTGAEIGATYNYSIDDTDDSTDAITGSGTIATDGDKITDIDVSSLTNGDIDDETTLTLTVYLTDSAGNQGSEVTATVTKIVTPISISVTTTPKTIFEKAYDEFDSTGIVITGTYKDGNTEELASDDYTIDSSAYSKSIAGRTYTITIIHNTDTSVETSYDVVVNHWSAYFSYTTSDSEVTITGYKEQDTEVEIPETIKGNNVVAIGEEAFYGCTSLESIEIPSGVTEIGSYAFSGCRKLTNINIPSGVTNISSSAFKNCSGLTNIDIPSGVTEIGSYALLTNINIPSGVTNISNSAFKNCSGLTNIDIPSGVTEIGGSAFFGCSSLESIVIPETVTTISSYIFRECEKLADLTLYNTVDSVLVSAFRGTSSSSGELTVHIIEVDGGDTEGLKGLIETAWEKYDNEEDLIFDVQ